MNRIRSARALGSLGALFAALAATPAHAEPPNNLGTANGDNPRNGNADADKEETPGPSADLSSPLIAPAPAPSTASPSRPRVSTSRKAIAAVASIVPGFVAHGTGHFIASDPSTGWRLLAIEGIGVGMSVSGISLIAATGASRRFIAPLTAFTGTGVGLFLISFLADLYGVLAPEGGTGSPILEAPWIETQVGYRYVYDAAFQYRSFITQSIDLRFRSFRLMPSGWFALDDSNARLRLLGSYRLFGPKPRGTERPRDGSFLDVEGALTHHRYGSDGFSITTGELSMQGRLDMQRVSPPLRGSFAELGWGAAVESYDYHGGETEGSALLIGRFGYGVYLGRFSYPRGEAMIYYDHRHDGFAAGLKLTGLGSGIIGHFGLQGVGYLNAQWGLLLDAQVGSAYLAGASLLFRYGATP